MFTTSPRCKKRIARRPITSLIEKGAVGSWLSDAAAISSAGAGGERANVELEAAMEHAPLTVGGLDRDVSGRPVAPRLVHLPGFDPRLAERSKAEASQVPRAACRDGSIKT